MDIYFILVEPAVPENIGASARAIKTMGFNYLRLVNTQQHLKDEARWLAHGSLDILEKAVVFSTVNEALQDMDFIIGTTSKKRSPKYDRYSMNEVIQMITKKKHSLSKIAILFGKEESGLSNEDLKICDVISSIPLQNSYPSLNLAQAVMLYAYSFSSYLFLKNEKKKEFQTDPNAFLNLKDKTSDLLNKLKMNPNIRSRVMERLNLIADKDIHLLHSIYNAISEKMGE